MFPLYSREHWNEITCFSNIVMVSRSTGKLAVQLGAESATYRINIRFKHSLRYGFYRTHSYVFKQSVNI